MQTILFPVCSVAQRMVMIIEEKLWTKLNAAFNWGRPLLIYKIWKNHTYEKQMLRYIWIHTYIFKMEWYFKFFARNCSEMSKSAYLLLQFQHFTRTSEYFWSDQFEDIHSRVQSTSFYESIRKSDHIYWKLNTQSNRRSNSLTYFRVKSLNVEVAVKLLAFSNFASGNQNIHTQNSHSKYAHAHFDEFRATVEAFEELEEDNE